MFRFTIRELVLLTLVVALGIGWWIDHCAATARSAALVQHAKDLHYTLGVAKRNVFSDNPTFMEVPNWDILDEPIPQP